jgi:transposase InsO family protein
MDERVAFIVAWQNGESTVAELSRQFQISRKTAYKTIDRFETMGWAGLQDLSRAPHRHPNAVSAATTAEVLVVRQRHPTWGPKKIRAWLRGKHPGETWPAQSTIGDILERSGLVKHRRRQLDVAPTGGPLATIGGPNDVWAADFKGWFRTGDGRRCEPFSLSDLASRFVLRLQGLERIDLERVWGLMDAAFREFGLPTHLRSDNGPPFASTAPGGLSALAVRLIKAGVMPERIARGCPQQNGRHERLHRTVKEDTATPPAASMRQQQRRFDQFCRVFNEERPHEALGQTPPATHYAASPRRYSGRLREPEYPSGYAVRRVHLRGEIKWGGERVFISEALIHEPIGLEPSDDGQWRIHYGPIVLGHLDEHGKFARFAAGTRPRRKAPLQPPG